MHACMHAYIHAYIHKYVCMCVYVNAQSNRTPQLKSLKQKRQKHYMGI